MLETIDFLSAIERATNISMAERPVEVTPFAGVYGLCGYALAINGSPVRVVLLVLVKGVDSVVCFMLIRCDGRSRRVGEKSPTALAAVAVQRALNLPLHTGAGMPQAVTA